MKSKKKDAKKLQDAIVRHLPARKTGFGGILVAMVCGISFVLGVLTGYLAGVALVSDEAALRKQLRPIQPPGSPSGPADL